MSYEIFTKCTYNKQTRCFDCASYSNNVWPRTANPWTMGYFAAKYPDATPDELKAALILAGLRSGDKYQSSVPWAVKYQKTARAWIDGIVARDGNDKAIDYYSLESARELMAFYQSNK